MPDITGITFEILLVDGSRRVAHFIRPDKVADLVNDSRVTIGDFLRSMAGQGQIDISGVEDSNLPAPRTDASIAEVDPAELLRLSAELERVIPLAIERAGLSVPKEATTEIVMTMLMGMVIGYARQQGITDAFLHRLMDHFGAVQISFKGTTGA